MDKEREKRKRDRQRSEEREREIEILEVNVCICLCACVYFCLIVNTVNTKVENESLYKEAYREVLRERKDRTK